MRSLWLLCLVFVWLAGCDFLGFSKPGSGETVEPLAVCVTSAGEHVRPPVDADGHPVQCLDGSAPHCVYVEDSPNETPVPALKRTNGSYFCPAR